MLLTAAPVTELTAAQHGERGGHLPGARRRHRHQPVLPACSSDEEMKLRDGGAVPKVTQQIGDGHRI